MTEPRQKPLGTRISARTRTVDEIPQAPKVKGERMIGYLVLRLIAEESE